MTVGVKIVQFDTGTTTLTADLGGGTPVAVLFFGGFQTSDGQSKFYGASDGSSQWAASDFTRAAPGFTRFAPTGRGALQNRDDVAINLLAYNSGVVRDTYATVDSFAPNTINMTWTLGLASTTTPITAIIFYGAEWTAQAGISDSSSAGSGTQVTTGFEPGLVFLAASATNAQIIKFQTDPPLVDANINDNISFGWATFPEPPFDPNSHSAGTTNTTRFGQFAMNSQVYTLAGIGFLGGGDNLGSADPSISSVSAISQQATSFKIKSSNSYVDKTKSFGYLALNWTGGRFMAGYMTPTISATTQSFTKWGGTYNGSNVDTDPSNHARPSFVMIGGFSTNITIGTRHAMSLGAFDGTDSSGFAYGGFPNGLATTYPLTVTQFNIPFTTNFTVLDTSGGAICQFTLTSLDDDGITVAYTVPPAETMLWPYLVFGQDSVTPTNTANLAVTEPNDLGLQAVNSAGGLTPTPSIQVFPDNVRTNPTIRERPDGSSMHLSTKLATTLAVTEPRDGTRKFNFTGTDGFPIYRLGDVNYRRWEGRTFYKDKSLPFIREGELGFERNKEDRTFRRPGEIKTFYEPPVTSGTWV